MARIRVSASRPSRLTNTATETLSTESRFTTERRGIGRVTPVIEPSIPDVLRERARLQPNDTAFTFIDYEQDWDGVAENPTWSQLYRRTLNLAQELKDCGSTGDRAVILAPQGLDWRSRCRCVGGSFPRPWPGVRCVYWCVWLG